MKHDWEEGRHTLIKAKRRSLLALYPLMPHHRGSFAFFAYVRRHGEGAFKKGVPGNLAVMKRIITWRKGDSHMKR